VKKIILFSIAFAFLLQSCNEDKSTAQKEVLTPADSFKMANQAYAALLEPAAPANDIRSVLCQGWEMEDDLDAIQNSNDAMGMFPFRSFYLNADSSFVASPRTAIEFGKWSYDDSRKTIVLKYDRGTKDEYKIGAVNQTELVVVNSGIGSSTKLKFVAAGKRYKDKSEDPYYIENNRWRIAPRKAETPEQVKQRLKACLRFYILFYRDNLAKDQKVISFYGFPTCMKWYAGGIFLVKEDDLQENWFGCFYNRQQAMQAHAMMDGIIAKKYKWSKEQMSWVKKNLLVLEQMYANL
jgi:hypothetical protein